MMDEKFYSNPICLATAPSFFCSYKELVFFIFAQIQHFEHCVKVADRPYNLCRYAGGYVSHTVYPLYAHLPSLYPYCIFAVPSLHPTVSSLFPYCILTVTQQDPYCTQLYLHLIPTVSSLYTNCIFTVSILYPHCINVCRPDGLSLSLGKNDTKQ